MTQITLSSVQAQSLLLLEHESFIGERDQIEGVARRFLERDTRWSIRRVNVAIEPLPSMPGNYIAISSGNYGLDALSTIKKQNGNGITIWVSHQVLDGLKARVKQEAGVQGIDVIALPGTAIDAYQAEALARGGSCVLRTMGVSHTMTRIGSIEAYQAMRNQFPIASRYLLVVLGGDTQSTCGQHWRYYSEKEARYLAEYVADWMQREPLTLLVSNGPRTGKFEPLSGKERIGVHRNGVADPVTQVFMQVLRQRKIAASLIDFHYEDTHGIRLNALLGAIASHPDSYALLPGESSSMIAQALAVLPKGSLTLFSHSAMNEVHYREFAALHTYGLVGILKLAQDQYLAQPSHGNSIVYQEAAAQIVDAIYGSGNTPTLVNCFTSEALTLPPLTRTIQH